MKHSSIGRWLAQFLLTLLLTTLAAYGQRYDSAPASSDNMMRVPASHPLDAAKAALGKRLFFDTRLSFDEWLSCSSCHDPNHAFSEPRKVSVGVRGRGKRHAPTLLNRGFGESQFWDGRAGSLEDQVLQPIVNPEEMGTTIDSVLQRLHQDPRYRSLTREGLADALASYIRTIRSEDTHYDLFLDGWSIVFSDLELEGLRLFRGKARCYLCHSGTQFTDESFHNTGIAWNEGALQDEGRAAVTGKTYHRGAFKTPTLRGVGERGPYMHDGSLGTLEEVINFYDGGGIKNPYLDENIIPLHLSESEKQALLAFLRKGLSGPVRDGIMEKPMQARAAP